MKVIILILFAIHCISAHNDLHIKTYEDFPNKCNEDFKMDPFVQIGKNYYFVQGSQKMNWFAAAHYCRTKNADLATIRSDAEMNDLSQYLISKGYNEDHWFWTSANDIVTAFNFQWLSTGQPVTYTRWSPGEPNNLGNKERCVHLWRKESAFEMNDQGCDSGLFFICQANTPKTVAVTVW